MNVVNLKLHQYIIITNPYIVESYFKLHDENPFDPIRLNCALDEEKNNLKVGLTSLVTYITCYKDSNQKSILFSFGLGKYVSVNAIIEKRTLKKWIANIDFDEYFLVSKKLNTKSALKYRINNSVMPLYVKFNSKDIVRTYNTTQEGKYLMSSLDRDSIGINDIPRKEPTSMSVIGKMIDGCIIRKVRNSESS